MPDEQQVYLAALTEELGYARGMQGGGQPSDPKRVADIEAEIARVTGKTKPKTAAADALETADVDAKLETTEGARAQKR